MFEVWSTTNSGIVFPHNEEESKDKKWVVRWMGSQTTRQPSV